MAGHSRYNVGNDEKGTLKNKLHVNDQKTLEDIETLLLTDTYTYFFTLLKGGKLKFNTKLIFEIHKYFLNTLYIWAGKIRTVEISKNGILFCASLQIKKALENFEHILNKNTPSRKDDKRTIAQKLAIIHCEFNAIHPFREGNGRTIRLFLDLITANYGYSLIDYSLTSKTEYRKACIIGMQQNYLNMQRIIYRGLS